MQPGVNLKPFTCGGKVGKSAKKIEGQNEMKIFLFIFSIVIQKASWTVLKTRPEALSQIGEN